MKKYIYFISFTANDLSMSGNTECRWKKQIKSIEDVRTIEKQLIKEFGFRDCQLLNYKLLDIEVGGKE